ncbi:MAG: hypothetical protein EBZ59_12650 [Planctomycetia bacterium]|nr:hypothetical protein [Planctomycetia bacterium]
MRGLRSRNNGILPVSRVTAYRGHARELTHRELISRYDELHGTVIELLERYGTQGPLCALVLLDGERGTGVWHCSDLALERSA